VHRVLERAAMTRLSLLASMFLFAACLPDDEIGLDETSEVESESTSFQGTTYQGTTYQGTTYQGTTYQGTTYQGTTYQGTTYQGAYYGSSTISGTAVVTKSTIEVWRRASSTRWEQRLPTQVCFWNYERTDLVAPCTNYALTSSPLVGMKFRGRFYDATTGTTRNGTLRVKRVTKDYSYAMHPLNGAGTTETKRAYDGTSCTNFDGCRRNSDLYLYDLELVDTDGSLHPFCYPGEQAFAFAGTWSLTGARTSGSTQFTFACTNGTIAKCARWGYRPFGSATTVGAQQVSKPMLPYHQSCVRAATADYCANGTSFTKDGTMIDIYDYEPHASYEYGFIPRMASMLYVTQQPGATALQWESRFDNVGATELDYERYQAAGGVMTVCPFQFSLPTAPSPDEPHKPYTREPPFSGPWVSVDTTTTCQHDETTQGAAMDFRCSACTTKFWNTAHARCITRGERWDDRCVKAARDMCTAGERMAAHSECTTGGALYAFDSACTLRVCASNASCCTSGWTSTCTAAANAVCTGGLEGSNFFGAVGFCGVSLGGPILTQ